MLHEVYVEDEDNVVLAPKSSRSFQQLGLDVLGSTAAEKQPAGLMAEQTHGDDAKTVKHRLQQRKQQRTDGQAEVAAYKVADQVKTISLKAVPAYTAVVKSTRDLFVMDDHIGGVMSEEEDLVQPLTQNRLLGSSQQQDKVRPYTSHRQLVVVYCL
jgi:hypothetical protein